MADIYVLTIDGLSDLTNLDSIPDKIAVAASRAINATAARARAESARRIRREIMFPAEYLNDSNGRLYISRRASPNQLEAVITGRRRPTSLSRFVTSSLSVGAKRQEGVTVEVKPGAARRLKRAFLVKLRSGTQLTDTKFNVGLAIRTKNGERPRNVREGAVKLRGGLWLLYGPSVQQAFLSKDGRGVASDITPEIENFLAQEFIRLVDLEL